MDVGTEVPILGDSNEPAAELTGPMCHDPKLGKIALTHWANLAYIKRTATYIISLWQPCFFLASHIDRPPPLPTPQLLWSGADLMRRPGAALGASKTTCGRRYRLKSTARTKRPRAWSMGHEAARRRVPRLGTRSASQQRASLGWRCIFCAPVRVRLDEACRRVRLAQRPLVVTARAPSMRAPCRIERARSGHQKPS